LRNTSNKDIKLIDASVQFADLLGSRIYGIKVNPDRVLESLFDFYFVGPARTQARKDALNKKLSDVGKPSLQ
jgi:hypothetical protein